MKETIYDNPEFFIKYKELRMKDKGLNGKIEEPAIRRLIGSVSGKTVLDIGCGFGHQLIWLTNNGVRTVVGIDPSKKMIESARKGCTNERITLIHGYYEETHFDEPFDHIVSSMAFHYVDNLEALLKKCFSDLSANGRLTFSLEHPICTANPDGYKEGLDWNYWELKDYFREGERKTTWFVEGVMKNHRTTATIINAVIAAGFTIQAIDEPHPMDRNYTEKEKNDDYFWIRPSLLIIDCKKDK